MQPAQVQDGVAPQARRNGDKVPQLLDALAVCNVEPLRPDLDEQVEVAGEQFHAKAIRKLFHGRGLPVTTAGTTLEEATCVLVPMPWNPHDSNAVAVLIDEHHVGYLPADLAEDYSQPLGAMAQRRLLVSGLARVWVKMEGPTLRARVTLVIPESEVLG